MDVSLPCAIFLLIVYALIHATDVALLALNDKRLEDMKAEGKKRVKLLKKLYAVGDRYSAAVRETLVIIAIVIVMLVLRSSQEMAMNSFFEKRNLGFLSYVIVVLAVSAAICVVGELIPRKVATARYAE